MDKRTRALIAALLGIWVLFPDFIPGHIDDIIAVIAMINQIVPLLKPEDAGQPQIEETNNEITMD